MILNFGVSKLCSFLNATTKPQKWSKQVIDAALKSNRSEDANVLRKKFGQSIRQFIQIFGNPSSSGFYKYDAFDEDKEDSMEDVSAYENGI